MNTQLSIMAHIQQKMPRYLTRDERKQYIERQLEAYRKARGIKQCEDQRKRAREAQERYRRKEREALMAQKRTRARRLDCGIMDKATRCEDCEMQCMRAGSRRNIPKKFFKAFNG